MPPMLVDLLMFRIILERLLDFDLVRAELLDVDPLKYVLEGDLAEELEALAGADDPSTLLRRHAIARALDLLDHFDPEDPEIPPGPGPANDD